MLTIEHPLEALKEAIQNSSLLQLHKDGSKVKRVKSFDFDTAQASVDKATIYIENLPDTITHQGLASLFSNVGAVQNVSLPTYKYSKRSKGFAFVTFTEADSIEKAIDQYNNCIP